MQQRKYTKHFKEQLCEAINNGESPLKISRKLKIARSLIYRWQEQYEKGALTDSIDLQSKPERRITELETLVGRLMADNELLKKALSQANYPPEKEEIYSGNIEIDLDPSRGDVKC